MDYKVIHVKDVGLFSATKGNIFNYADKGMILKTKIEDSLKYAGMLGKEEKFTRVKDLSMKYRREKERYIKNEF
jgi:hypothetical protein